MAAHRIRATTNNNASLPRCKSEGTLIDLTEGVSEASLTDVKGQQAWKAYNDTRVIYFFFSVFLSGLKYFTLNKLITIFQR